ncbi:MAG: DUF3079 domain-containing protein [Acidobacteriota bacterium]
MPKAKLPLQPQHPERVCWGCDKYCAADDLRCGNGTIRTQHPVELFGDDWQEWELGQCADNPTICARLQTVGVSKSQT